MEEGVVAVKAVKARLIIVSNGTRGDIQPYVIMAQALLKSELFEVAIATHKEFEPFVRSMVDGDVTFYGMDGSPSEMMNDPEFVTAFYDGGLRDKSKFIKKMMAAQVNNKSIVYEAVKSYRPQIIVATVTTLLECTSVGSRLGCIPVVIACTFPAHPTEAYPPVTLMGEVPDWLQRPMANFATSVFWSMIKDEYEAWRSSLFLRPLPGYSFAPAPHLNLFSVALSPRPKDLPGYVYDVGFMVAKPKAEEKLSEELEAFLAAGTPPIYLGFGSMPMRNLASLAQDFAAVCTELGRRGIVCSGWFALRGGDANDNNKDAPVDLGPHMLHIKGAPHSLLFPRCCAAIHHGGAGTTAATLHAGIPAVIFPVLGDQTYWASQCAKLGVGPPTVISVKQLNRDTLLSQLRSVLDDGGAVARAASDMGKKLCVQDATKGLAQLIHNLYLWMKPVVPLEDHFGEDEEPTHCKVCKTVEFGLITRKHQVSINSMTFWLS